VTLVSPSEHDLLVLWVQLPLLLLVAWSLGQLMRRIGQPAVIGELGAGLLLGPSVFGRLWPAGFSWVFPGDALQSAMLLTVAWIGVVLLLVGIGSEADLGLLRRQGKAAALVGTGSLVVPLAGGLAVGLALPDRFIGPDGDGIIFALFMAAALSISSLPVIAKILGELDLFRRDFGQVMLAAGMANDIVGWLVLGVVAGIATSGSASLTEVARTLLGIGLLGVFALTIGRRGLDGTLRWAAKRKLGPAPRLSILVVFALTLGAATQWLGVEAVLGAFIAGIVLRRTTVPQDDVVEGLEMATVGFFAPIFFATAGLRADLATLFDGEVATWALVVVAVAALSKLIGAGIGALAAGMARQEALALGAGMNARGALEIVIATVGLTLGVLNDTSYTVVVLLPMLTSMAAPPTLRMAVASFKGTDEEQERLRREHAFTKNVVLQPTRVLLPSRGGKASIVAAQLAQLAWPEEAPVTVLSVGNGDRADVRVVLDVLHERDVTETHVDSDDPLDAVVVEAALGYGAIVIGADGGPDGAVSPLIAGLLRDSGVPVLVVRPGRAEGRLPSAFARAVVPVSGTAASRAAQEVAFGLGERLGTEVVLAHVVQSGDHRPAAVGRRLIDKAAELAALTGARTKERVTVGDRTVDELLATVEEVDADLVVVGANLRDIGDASPYLGSNVERILRECPVTVAVVAIPSAASD
jgi:Kef-type K+ transport system membrane component KefB